MGRDNDFILRGRERTPLTERNAAGVRLDLRTRETKSSYVRRQLPGESLESERDQRIRIVQVMHYNYLGELRRRFGLRHASPKNGRAFLQSKTNLPK